MKVSLLRVPFFLEPDYPEEESWSVSNLERLRKKWGGVREFKAQKTRHQLKERGHAVGIDHYILDRQASNTMRSHRLVQHVSKTRSLGAAERLYNDLNERHFLRGEKLNDATMLAEAAERAAGVPREETLAFLGDAAEPGRAEIEAAFATCHRLGIHGIPNFVIDGSYSIGGAAGADEFTNILDEIDRMNEPPRDPIFAKILGVGPTVYNSADSDFIPDAHYAPCAPPLPRG